MKRNENQIYKRILDLESNGLLNLKGDRKSFSVNNTAIPKDDPNYG